VLGVDRRTAFGGSAEATDGLLEALTGAPRLSCPLTTLPHGTDAWKVRVASVKSEQGEKTTKSLVSDTRAVAHGRSCFGSARTRNPARRSSPGTLRRSRVSLSDGPGR
jgi:hypothetical protein